MSRRKCCASCTVFSDSFGSDDLSTKWTDTSGWSIDTEAETLSTSSSNAKILAVISWKLDDGTIDDPDTFHPHVITATLVAKYGSTSRIWWASGYAEIEWSAGCRWHICKTDGTLLGMSGVVSASDGDDVSLTICVKEDSVNVGGYEVALASDKVEVGYGTGTASGETEFKTFTLKKHADEKDSCPSCTGNGCTYFSDDFAVDDLADAWDVTGSASVAGGVLTLASGATATCKIPYPDDDGEFHPYVIEVSMKAVAGSRSKVIFGGDNYLEVYWNGASSYCYIKDSGGTTKATSEVQSFTNGSWHGLKICVTEGGASVNESGRFVVIAPITNTTEQLGCEGPGDFRAFLLSKHYSEDASCPECITEYRGCGWLNNDVPVEIMCVVSGITTTEDCEQCNGMNGTYICEFELYTEYTKSCRWHGYGPVVTLCACPGSAGTGRFSLEIYTSWVGSNYYFGLQWGAMGSIDGVLTGSCDHTRWNVFTRNGPFTKNNMKSVIITPILITGTYRSKCDYSNMTCVISVL